MSEIAGHAMGVHIQQKVLSWVHHVDCLAEAAGSQPQDAYAALTKSLSFKWTFVQRVVQECGDLFEPVEEMICDKSLPQLLGSEFTPEDRAVFALPVKFAGLGIPIQQRQQRMHSEHRKELPVILRMPFSGRLTSGSRPGQAVPSPLCQRSKDEGKLRPKFTKCEKINIFEQATGFRPPVAIAKPKWRQILLSLTLFSNVTSKERKPMSCACSVFIPVKRMGVCNFSPMG